MSFSLPDSWKNVDWLLTDVDDTLTWQGNLPSQTLQALEILKDSGIKVVAVTGASAGWCDHIAHLWPVSAVIGENGAFVMEKTSHGLSVTSFQPEQAQRDSQQRLLAELKQLLKRYPERKLSGDQPYRRCEVAIDIGQTEPKADDEEIRNMLADIHALGANATASSIHVNVWYGEHSKKHAALRYLTQQNLSAERIAERACYIGDSPNDAEMFQHFPLSAGVANIQRFWAQLPVKPSVITPSPGGYGFAEFALALVKCKVPKP